MKLIVVLSMLVTVHTVQCTYEFQQQLEQEPTTLYGGTGAYQFAYRTGNSQYNSETAHHFREESRDEYGNVVGKYGYLDPYGQLRVVNYRAGPNGYEASGDVGVDQEAIRQQRLLYSGDEATRIQAEEWRKLGSNFYSLDNSVSQKAFSKASASAFTGAHNYASERLVSAPVKGYSAPVKAVYTAPTKNLYTSTYNRLVSPARVVAVKNPVHHITASEILKSPAARLTEISSGAAGQSTAYSAASASAAASSSASYTSGGIKGGAVKTVPPVKVARYTNHGRAHAVVNFNQFGPQPFQYSYSF